MPRRVRAVSAAAVAVFLVVSSLLATTGAPERSRGVSQSLLTLANDAGPAYAPAGDPPVNGSTPIRLVLALNPLHPSALAALDQALANPASPEYRRFLTESQFESRFAPPAGGTDRLVAYFRAHGGTGFSRSADGLSLALTLPAGAFPEALGTRLLRTGSGAGGPLYRAAAAPALPANLGALVAGIGGMTDVSSGNAPLVAALLPTTPDQYLTAEGTDRQLLLGSDLAQAYGDAGLFPGSSDPNGTFGAGTAVATLLMSGYNYTARTDVAPFDPAAVSNYFNDTFAPWWPLPQVEGVPVPLDGISPPPAGPPDPYTDDTNAVAENSLDLEMAGSMAPGARLLTFYFPESVLIGNPGSTYGDLADDFALDLSSALSYNYSPARLATVSNSYALPDLNDSLWDLELAHAEALGVTVVAATGDEGNAPAGLTGRIPGEEPDWPATAAFEATGVLAVGGTELNLTGLPTSVVYPAAPPELTYDTSIGGIASEQGWSTTWASGLYAGSEGGVSTVYREPSWQSRSAAQGAVVNATVIVGNPRLGRAVPDLALAASDVLVETAIGPTGPTLGIYDGTSLAAPLVAGALAECAARAGTPFGFLDPLLYRWGSFWTSHPAAGDPAFHDITTGSNYLFRAAPGWDPVTGWGSLNVAGLPAALANATLANFTFTGPTPVLPPVRYPAAPAATSSPPAPAWSWWVAALGAAVALSIGLYVAGLRESARLPEPPPAPGRHPGGTRTVTPAPLAERPGEPPPRER